MGGSLKKYVLCLCFCFATALAVEELPVSIKGDSLVYNNNLITASGNASFAYGGYEISADQIVINTSTNMIIGNGKVLVSQGGGEALASEQFEYNITDEKVKLYAIKSAFKPKLAQQDIFFNIAMSENHPPEDTTTTQDILEGHNCRLTTCDLESPHYWLSAKEFLFYPGQKVVGYHVTAHFWFSPVPLFYTPYYAFHLGKRRIVMKPPIIGSNTVEGNFIKTETVYFVDDFNEGSIFVDAMQLKGNGLGWYHKYNFGQPGSFYYYHVKEQDVYPKRDTNIVKWHQEYSFSAFDKLTLDHNYQKTYLLPTGFDDRMEDRLVYNYQQDKDQANLNYKFTEDYQNRVENQRFNSQIDLENNSDTIAWQKDYNNKTKYRYESINLTHVYQINDEMKYQINPAFKRNQTGLHASDERLDLGMDLFLTPRQKQYYESLQVHYNWYFDPDQDRVTLDSLQDEFVEKVPEITLKALPIEIIPITNNSAVAYMRSTYTTSFIRESKYFPAYNKRRFFESSKYSADFDFYRDFGLDQIGSTLHLGRIYKQVGYGTKDSYYLLSDKPYLNTDLWGFFRSRMDYEDTRGDGNSPFFYDDPSVLSTKRGTHRLALYQRKQWEAAFTTAKDFDTYVYFDDLYNIYIDPLENKVIYYTATSGKNRYTNLYRDLVTGVTIKPNSRHSLKINLTKDINDNFDENENAGKLKSAASELDFIIGDTYEQMGRWSFWESQWHFTIKNQYDFNIEYFNLQTFALEKDLHCWQMRYNFTPVRKEWYIVFSLKAFPEEPLTIKGNEDQDVSFEAFSDVLHADPVRRY